MPSIAIIINIFSPYSAWANRYAYQVAPFAIIMWLGVFQPRYLLKNKIPHIGFVFFIAYVLNNDHYFNIPPYNRNLNWKEDVKILQSSIDTG